MTVSTACWAWSGARRRCGGCTAPHGRAHNALGEREHRFEVFRDNLRFIDAHNAGAHVYRLVLNRFADLTDEEFRAAYLGTRPRGSAP